MPIDIQVDAMPSGGLKLIEHIPGIRPCRLEGQNGIGKSATIKLLVLAAGGQPFAGDGGAWLSLRENLGDAKVTLTGIAGTTKVELSYTPGLWPDLPNLEIGDALGILRVDGKERPASELHSMLDVMHLSGTERLVDTLQGRRQTYGAALRTVKARLDSMDESLARLGLVADRLEFVSPAQAARDSDLQQTLEKRRRLESRNLQELADRLVNLHRAAALQAMLTSSDLKERAKELARAVKDLEQARQRAEGLDEEVDRAITALDEGSKTQKAIASEERKLNALQRRRVKRVAQLSTLAARRTLDNVDLVGDLSSDELRRLRDRVEGARRGYRDIELKYRQSRMTDAQRRIHNELRVVLDDGVQSGLADFAVLQLDTHDITIGQLADAIAAPQPADEISSAEVTEAETVWNEFVEILAIHEEGPAYLAATKSIEDDLTSLRAEAPEQDELQKAVADARKSRDNADTEVLSLTQRIGRLQAQGIIDEEITAASQTVQETLQLEGVAADELQTRVDQVARDHGELAHAADLTKKQLEEVVENQARRAVQRRSLVANIEGSDLGWLSPPGEPTLAQSKHPDDWWTDAALRARHFTELAASLVEAVSGLEYASSRPLERGAFAAALNAVVEKEAIEDFANPAISEALFEGGRPISVDLQKATITWDTPKGQRREKPLSTFSSGEQALGFMRARLRQIAEQPADSRIVFLDEFGAFLSADRRHPLTELLKGDELATLSDEVVIVLPLQVDYAAQLHDITGSLETVYKRRADAIATKGYFTETFDE